MFNYIPFWSPVPFRGIGKKERHPQEDSLDFCDHLFYTLLAGLGTLVRQRETVRLYDTFPTERSGSRQECRAWVKRSRSMITLLTRHAEPARVPCQGALMCQPLKPKQLTRERPLSCGRG